MQSDMSLVEIIRTGILIYISAMLPMLAARGAIILAAAVGADWFAAYLLASMGAATAAALMLKIDRDTLEKLRRWHIFDELFAAVDRHISEKHDKIERRAARTLAMLVGIPFSGVGVCAACIIAKLLDLDYRTALLSIAVGIFINCFFTTAAVYGLLTGVQTILSAVL